MKIIKKNEITFGEIDYGEFFKVYDIFMIKIHPIQQVNNDKLINAIGIITGDIYSIPAEEKVELMKNVELIYE